MRSFREQAMWAAIDHDLPKARDLLRKWVEADPGDSDSWYNLACLEARLGSKEASLEAFDTAVDAGFSNVQGARSDSDLTAVRSEPRFAAALARVPPVAVAKGLKDVERRFTPVRTLGTYLVMLPPDYLASGRDYPLCVLLHGSGSSEVDDAGFADDFGRQGVIYIAIRAPYPDISDALPGQVGWTRWPAEWIEESDPMFDVNIAMYPELVFDCVRDAQSHYRVKKGKVFVHGYSQGGGAAMECALLHPDLVASVFVLSGSKPKGHSLTQENLARMKAEGVRVYFMHGQQDGTVPVDTAKNLAKALDQAGVQETLTLVKGGHVPTKDRTPIMRQWVDAEIRGMNDQPQK